MSKAVALSNKSLRYDEAWIRRYGVCSKYALSTFTSCGTLPFAAWNLAAASRLTSVKCIFSAAYFRISAVLSACGILDKVAFRTVRFSFGRDSSRAQVDRVVNELKSIAFFGKYGSSLLSAINKGPLPGFWARLRVSVRMTDVEMKRSSLQKMVCLESMKQNSTSIFWNVLHDLWDNRATRNCDIGTWSLPEHAYRHGSSFS